MRCNVRQRNAHVAPALGCRLVRIIGVWDLWGSDFAHLHNIHTGSGAQQAFYVVGTLGSFPMYKVARPCYCSHFSAAVESTWNCISTSPLEGQLYLYLFIYYVIRPDKYQD
jgi:hypothetical protein